MRNVFKLLFVSFFICSCSNYKNLQARREINIDEVYKSWNKQATTFTEIDKNSLRYKFLERLQNQYIEFSDYYIIESPISGEYYMSRVWVIYSRNKKSTDVVKYEFTLGSWNFKDSFLLPYQFKYRYKDYIRKNEVEFNYHDVTVSHIINDRVVSCDFFKAGSMKKFVFELPEISMHF
ncbi:MAG: hypothetical protein K2P85_05100 [Flavobacteriaceae bacterium]|nr:hypothetical protein [Flavobacteriaceae bacterium]